jgi:hypothetical protein
MRAIAALLLLSACATTQAPPAERLRGCWIERSNVGGAVTMRWLPDANGELRGDLLRYSTSGASGRERYVLRNREGADVLCQIGEAETCWTVAQGDSGSLEGGRAFIDQYGGDRIRISVIDTRGQRVIFQGDRDGCD